MVDDEKHTTLGKWSKKDYMREYMRERRKKSRQQPAPSPRADLHGPVAPPNLPRTGTARTILQAHYAHVLNLWAETGKELAHVTETDEMVNTLESLMLENKHLKVEVENLREALKTCQGKPQEPQETLQQAPKTCQGSLQENSPPTTQEPLEPGLVDPDRRPKSAEDPPAPWML